MSPFLQRRRIKAALPYLRPPLLDYGCGNGGLYRYLSSGLRQGYLGYDPDPGAIGAAKAKHADAKFISQLHELEGHRFDSIVSLAVIEHVPSVFFYLRELRSLLNERGKIVVTSPHPAFDKVHRLGARIGIFSWEASEEHNEYVTVNSMEQYCEQLALKVLHSERFLLGANQLFVLQRVSQQSEFHDDPLS